MELSRTVLLVAPDSDSSGSISSVLADAGHRVIATESVPPEVSADVAIVLVKSGQTDGLALCRTVRKRASGTKIVLVSTRYEREPDVSDAFDAWIAHPFTHVELTRDIASAATPDQEFDESTLPTRGRLSDTAYETLLYKSFTGRSTGCLLVRHDKTEHELFLLRGLPVWARSNTFSEALGTLLMRRGLINSSTLNDFLRKPSRLGVGLGTRLVNAGIITADQLSATLDEQVRERVLLGFSFSEGDFEFTPRTDFIDEFELFVQNPIELLFNGAAQLEDTNALAERFQERASSWIVPTDNCRRLLPFLELDADVLEFLERLDGTLRLSELLPHWMGTLPAFFRFLWGMLANRMAYTSTSPAASPKPVIEFRDDFIGYYRAARSLVPRTLDIATSAETEHVEVRSKRQSFEVLEELVELHDFLEHLNHFDLFGLEFDASPQQVRNAIEQRVNALAPDLIRQLPETALPRIAEVGRRIKLAARILLDEEERATYLEQVLAEDDDVRLDRISRGLEALDAQEWNEAQSVFQELVDENPVDARATALLARTLHLRDPGHRANLNTAKALLHRAVAFDDGYVDAHYFLGAVELKLGNSGHALHHVERALELDPDHEDAGAIKAILSGDDGGTIRIVPGLFEK